MGALELVRLATDYLPALGQDAPDLIYGPWSDELVAIRPRDRALLVRAMAIAGVETIQGSPFSGAEMWARNNITPSVEDRARVRMVSDVPLGLWRIDSREGNRTTLTDLLGLDQAYLPHAPILLLECLSVYNCEGPYLLARVGWTPGGWQAHLPLALPAIPSLELIRAWLHRELLHARLRSRKITLERLLKRRGHVLIRRLHEGLWLRQEEAPTV
jgi:hypothetical protein